MASLLTKEVRKSGEPFKQVVNRYLRLGFTAAKLPARKPFVVKPRSLGLPAGMNYDNVQELLDALEGPDRR